MGGRCLDIGWVHWLAIADRYVVESAFQRGPDTCRNCLSYGFGSVFPRHRLAIRSFPIAAGTGRLLAGHLLLAMSMGLHARYVLLDAEGGLPKRAVKKKAEKKLVEKKALAEDRQGRPAATDDVAEEDFAENGRVMRPIRTTARKNPTTKSGDTWVAVDPPHGKSQPVLKRVTPAEASTASSLAQKSVVSGAVSSSSVSAADDSKLSKADRKALKKKLIEERMKREQGGELVN